MQFTKYNSIENSYQQDFINTIIEQGFGNLEYVVQEKVHGANLSFITDGITVLSAKRTELIGEDEQFYNSKTVLENYRNKILELFKQVNHFWGLQRVTIFGELFGGGYPHPDIPKDHQSLLIQRGIYYIPVNDFYAFDILLENGKFLDVETATAIFETIGFIHAKTLFKGTLKECLAYPNEFKTTIPVEYGLPALEGNICEGVVIRPQRASFLRNGSRILIKNKNEKWTENNNYVDKATLKILLKEEELSEGASLLCEELFKLITQNRLTNLLSKIGEVNSQKDLGKILGLYNKDVLTEFLKNYKEQYEKLEKHESKSVNKFLNKHAGQLITNFFEK